LDYLQFESFSNSVIENILWNFLTWKKEWEHTDFSWSWFLFFNIFMKWKMLFNRFLTRSQLSHQEYWFSVEFSFSKHRFTLINIMAITIITYFWNFFGQKCSRKSDFSQVKVSEKCKK
jgi:hypothetical protein